MTYDEFVFQFSRLAKGHGVDPKAEKINAFFERVRHYDVRDWQWAVTDLLCAKDFPWDVKRVLDACETAANQRRQKEKAEEHQAANRFFKGDTRGHIERSPEEESYGRLCAAMILVGISTPEAGKMARKWLENPDHAAYAHANIDVWENLQARIHGPHQVERTLLT